jgi:hypothetical protein
MFFSFFGHQNTGFVTGSGSALKSIRIHNPDEGHGEQTVKAEDQGQTQNTLIKGIVLPFELGGETRLIRSAVINFNFNDTMGWNMLSQFRIRDTSSK